MAEIINTKKRDYQYNGPVESSDYNLRIEENYKDLVYLYNKSNLLDDKLSQAFERVLKDHIFISTAIKDLEDRLLALEAEQNKLSIYSFSQLDYANFIGTPFAITGTELLTFDPTYNIITLPKVTSSCYSKIKLGNPTVGQIVPDLFKASISRSYPGVDTNGAVIDTTPIYNCILDQPDKIWKRNVIAPAASPAGAQMMLYIAVPSEISGSLKTNLIKLNPYPTFGTDIVSIEYTQTSNPTMSDSDGWRPLNSKSYYNNDQEAIGKVPPGGWSTVGLDTIVNSGPLAFIFPDLDITAIRIKFRQRNYLVELSKYIYTYGLSDLDIRYDKFLPTGKMIIKFTPPNGELINNVINVTPKIYNVPLSLISTAFSYRVIYGVPSIGGMSYTETNPGVSNSVWIEVTLNMLDDKTAPVLSDLIIQYD